MMDLDKFGSASSCGIIWCNRWDIWKGFKPIMRHYELQTTATHYRIEDEQTLLTQEPAFLERNGEPLAVLLPLAAYEAFQAWQSLAADPSEREPDPAFAREVAAFERLKPQLLQQYPGRVVGIYQGEIVAVGDNRLDVLDQVWDQFGEVSCYIETVEPVTPRRARMPSVRIRK